MRINVTSVFVDDQRKALRFCTEVFGFQKKTELPLGDVFWLTVEKASTAASHDPPGRRHARRVVLSGQEAASAASPSRS